ncbi:MAG: SHOCT domain-containing protein [Actinomycetota bacterium]|nr:SHOCT domain-containing protein [Actinomycetota bacterium]
MIGWGVGWMWAWPVLVLIGLVLLGVVAYGLLRGGHRPETGPGRVTARDILDERFARGEIEAEEYRQRVSGLL